MYYQKNLKRLKFGFEYNKKIDKSVLPNGLEYLHPRKFKMEQNNYII